MKMIIPGVEWWPQKTAAQQIARVGRVCYKSKGKQPDENLSEEQKEKFLKLQEKLRRETADYEHVKATEREIAREQRAEEKLSELSYDPTTGKMRMSNKLGTRSEVRDATAAEKLAWERGEEEYGLKRQDTLLSLDAKRANINQSNASAEASRAQAGYYRSGVGRSGSSGRGGSGTDSLDSGSLGDDDYTIGQEILSMRKGLVSSLENASVDPALIEEAAATAVRAATTNAALKTKQQRMNYALQVLERRLYQLKTPAAGTVKPEFYQQTPLDRPR